MKRTHYAGALEEKHIGQTLTVCGWVQTKRDMGGVIFLDVHDREGTLQVVCNAQDLSEPDFRCAESMRAQSVVAVSGVLRQRDEETYNPKLPTGTIELRAQRLELLSAAATLPFAPDDDAPVREDLRLKYRFLDLRRPAMLHNLQFRHALLRATHAYLDGQGFIEVETPMLTKSTPEGARDYLVPSRVHPGTFYALPQSPQIFKQLLMVGGIDKYYQVARCFRDEDLRADRQPEFTQVDMELSFVDQEDILRLLEDLFSHLMKELKGVELPRPFRRLTWQEAMDVYGSDKPDLRFGLPIVDLTDIGRTCGFAVFRGAVERGGVMRAICVPGGGEFTHTQIDELTACAQGYGAKGMAWIALRPSGERVTILNKYLSDDELEAIIARTGAQNGDFILFCADKLATVRRTLGGLRGDIAGMLNLRRADDYQFLFVTDFPQFEYSEEEGRYMSMHHPFTMPYEEDLPYLQSDPARVRAQAYDVVLNGIELGSGSIRIHRSEVQEAMFEALGFTPAQIADRFGFLVGAFQYGTPPHGGFAFGVDRLAMLLVGADSLRDVIAFPKTKDASCLLTGAPDQVDAAQLEELHLTAGELAAAADGGAEKQAAPTVDLDRVAELSRLSLTAAEQQTLPGEMAAIVAFADQLAQIPTDGVPVTAHVVPQQNVFRADAAVNDGERDALLANAPTKADGYITVPRVVE